MRLLKIEHTTRYEYAQSVELQPHKLLIRPREGHDVRIRASQLQITPANTVKWIRDVYGNSVCLVNFTEMSNLLSIHSEALIEHYEDQPLNFLVAEQAVSYPFNYDSSERLDLVSYQNAIYADNSPSLQDWLKPFWQPGQIVETYVLLDSINKTIARNFAYRMREEPGVQSPAQTLACGSGSCRDFATLFIEACRFLGLAARFVSGYLHCPVTAAGHGATHAWSEVYLPGAGWKGFDSTGGEVVGPNHIAVAVSRHPETVPPVSGAFFGAIGAPIMRVNVTVSEMLE